MLAAVLPLLSIAASQICLTLAFICFVTGTLLERKFDIAFPPIKLPLLLFMVTTFVAYWASPETAIGAPPLRKFVLFVIIPLVVNQFTTERVFRTYHLMFIVGGISASFSIYQYLFLSKGSVEARLTGFMGNWMTHSGEMMLVFLSLAAYLVFVNPNRKPLWALGFVVLGISLALTLTRSVWIATVAGLFVILLMKRFHWKNMVVIGLALGVLVLVAPDLVQKRVKSILDPEDPSNYARLAIWKAGWKMVKAHPWVGVGPQRVSKVFYDYHPVPSDRWRDGFFPVHMHSNLLQFAAERGIPCALAWLWLIFKIASDHRSGFRRSMSQSDEKTIHAIAFVSVLSFFLAGLFEFNFGDSEVLMIFLFLVSAPYAVTGQHKPAL